MVNTTIKPDHLIELATTEYQQFKETLEGKLPFIYLWPLSIP